MYLAAARRAWSSAGRQLLVFRGRAGLGEYWWTAALVVVVVLVVGAVGGPVSRTADVLASLLPLTMLSVTVRRLHDGNRSGWSLLFGLIPIVGGIFLLVWLVSEGTRTTNRFGPPPEFAGAVAPETAAMPPAKPRVYIDADGRVTRREVSGAADDSAE